MQSRRILPTLAVALTTATIALADGWQKLRDRGAEAYYVDDDLRTAFAESNPGALPESKRKVPPTTAKAFDWTSVVKGGHLHVQKDSINCWAFAALGAFEWNWAIRNGTPRLPDLSLQPALDRVQKNGGGFAGWALEDLLKHGTCEAKAYAHTGKPGRLRRGVETPYRLVAWGLVAPQGGVPTVEQIKRALVDHGPLVANVHLTPAFQSYKGGVFAEHPRLTPGTPPAGHILVIVGWDDRKGRDGCWKIENSWGLSWGEGGFMWIEYGSNDIGHSACWVRAQSTQYDLPDGLHDRLGGDADPFPTWPGSKPVSLPPPADLPALDPARALKRVGERATVKMKVQGGDVHSSDGHAELFSKPSWRDEGCLIVRILKSDLAKFPTPDPRALVNGYRGKTILVRGSIQPNPIFVGDRPIIEVSDPSQIERVKD